MSRQRLTDLPWGEITVKLELQTRKFFCDNDECRQRIFCERLPEVVAPYGIIGGHLILVAGRDSFQKHSI
jgi:hypothetical protein